MSETGIIPHSREAEEAVLGAVLINPECFNELSSWLGQDDFYIHRHGFVWQACARIQERGDALDLLTLSEELDHLGHLADVGGAAYLTSLINSTPTSLHAEAYGRIVADTAARRRLLAALSEIARQVYQEDLLFENVLEAAEKAIFNLSQNRLEHQLRPIESVVAEVYDQVTVLSSSKEKTVGVPTGFIDLDRILNGLQPSDLLLVAGRPGQGKTGFLLSLARGAAGIGKSVAIFSLEMSAEQLVRRLLSQETGIDVQRLRLGKLNDEEWTAFAQAAETLSQLPILLDDTPALTPAQLRSICRRQALEAGLDLVMVDYLQLMSGGSRFENRIQEVGYISRSLKALARELKMPVLAAAQLSRAVEQRMDKKPTLADLRESGALEMDSDVVMFLYRPETYDPGDPLLKGLAEVHVAKHRNGPLGNVELVFRAELARFENAATKAQRQGAA